MVFGIWHILLTCAPFAGGLSNALAIFTRRGAYPWSTFPEKFGGAAPTPSGGHPCPV